MIRRSTSAWLSLILVSIWARAASAADAADARALFTEGITLLSAGKTAEACLRLEQSGRLEPAASTILLLANCYDRSGRRALALRTYREGAKAARAQAQVEAAKLADDRARAIEGALPKLVVQRGPTPGAIRVTVDGAALSNAELGEPIAVDPGAHAVVAKAEGRRAFSSSIAVRDATVVTIPLLEPEKPKVEERSEGSGRRLGGIVVMGAGTAGLVFSAVSAGFANGALSDAKAQCPSYPARCAPAAQAPNDRAQSWSTSATVSFVAGGLLVAFGAALVFWPVSPRSSVSVGTTGTELFIRGEL